MFLKPKYLIPLYALLIVATALFVSLWKPAGQMPRLVSEDEELVFRLGFLNLSDSVEYVGIDDCKECHLDMYQAYMRTGMGKSWGLANQEKSASDFNPHQPLHDQKSDYYYQPFWNNDQMKVKEFRMDGSDTIYQQTRMVDFIVGSGQHTNSHIRSVNGYLFQVPFTYYTQIGLLDFPPGFEGGNNARFSRTIGFECITCHNSYPIPVKQSLHKYESIPLGINCERCHGPGELHVAAMKAGRIVDTDKQTDYTIVNPKRLPEDLRFELCARCHSQGNAVLKEGKDFFDFKPGMYLSEVMDVFREKYENEEDAFWMETHPERLRKSNCYIATQDHPDFKPLNCTDCHFTAGMRHISIKETPIDTFRKQCMQCHNPNYRNECSEQLAVRLEQEDNCITCHMVKTGVFDIPHVMISDHFIRVTDKWKKPGKSTHEIEAGNFLGLKCMSSEHPDNLTLARAYLYHFEKFMPDPTLLDSSFYYLKMFSERDQLKWWVYYYFLKTDYSKIVNLAETYLKSDKIEDAVLNYQVGQSYHYLRQTANAITYFSYAVELQSYNLDYRNKLGTEYLVMKDYTKARDQFEFILAENPEMVQAQNNLGFVFLLTNDFVKAEKSFTTALSLDPDYLNAHLNLLKLYISKGDNLRARGYFRMLKQKFPDSMELSELERLIN
ncbi:tetratricopeptide repeat protein [Bacteroidota bacterium]